jgi:outer membrane lipoprotein-sorting protein
MTRRFISVLALLLPALVAAEDPSGQSLVENMQRAFFSQGETFSARVKMTLTAANGRERLRDMTMKRVNMPGGKDQRYFILFHAPGDVRGTAFLVHKYAGREDDRWLFVPALNLVQRVAARDAGSSFVGSDFTYEDVSGRDVSADSHRLLREEPFEGKSAYVVESLPRGPAPYKRKLSWIDKAAFLPLKEEFYDAQDQLFKVFTADDIQSVEGVPTATKRTMKNVKSGHRTLVEFTRVEYRRPLRPQDFNERALRNPPREWTAAP